MGFSAEVKLAGQRAAGVCQPPLSQHRYCKLATALCSLREFWGLNSGPHACVTSALPAEPSPEPLFCPADKRLLCQRLWLLVSEVSGSQSECDSQKPPFWYHWCSQCSTACPVPRLRFGALGSEPFPVFPAQVWRSHYFHQGAQTRSIHSPDCPNTTSEPELGHLPTVCSFCSTYRDIPCLCVVYSVKETRC